MGDRPIEPMLRINHSGYGVKVATLVQVVVILVPIVGTWYNLTLRQEQMLESLKEARQEFAKQIADLQALAEKNRLERIVDIKELRVQAGAITADVARLQEQFKNLQLMLGDLRKQHFEKMVPEDRSQPHPSSEL